MGVLVIVGSTNPTKIEATKRGFRKVFGSVTIKSVMVDSGVSKQPIGDNEIVRGAINRAIQAARKERGAFGVGLEGGIVKYSFGSFVKGWVAIVKNGQISIASTISLPLPDRVVELVLSGKVEELEDAMYLISGIKNLGEKMGAIGFFTNNIYDRIQAFEDAMVCALAPFIKKEFY
ncbi:MAG: inosine/xanthosine triphosphatase [Candidatus Njordarchaeum guaymaensis]